MHDLFQLLPVDGAVLDEPAQVDRTQVAGFVGQQRLLAAGVGGFDLADQRGRVVAVEAVEEDDARLAVLPGLLDDALEDLAGVQWCRTTFLSRGLIRSYSSSCSTAFMKFSVRPTEMLKLLRCFWSALHMMKSMMSG